jgi:hypothetical protein
MTVGSSMCDDDPQVETDKDGGRASREAAEVRDGS